jgi:hypothetical protein
MLETPSSSADFPSAGVQNSLHRKSELLPTDSLDVQTAAARRRQFVDSRATIILRCSHLGLDVAAQLEPVESWVQRPLARIQPVTGNLSNTVGDTPAVIGAKGKDLQNQYVERTLEEVGFRHGALSSSERKYEDLSLGGQGEDFITAISHQLANR